MKKTLVIALIVITLLVILLAGVSCKKKAAAVLRIGTNAEYPPFESKDGDKFIGVDMDLARAIAEKMGMQFEIIDMDFDALIPSLTSNKIDLALSAITITEDRMQQVDFSVPYYIANQVIIARQDSPLKVEKLEDIVNYKVGAQNGTTGQIYVQENLVDKNLMKKDNLKKYSTNIEAITDMLNKNIDFVIIDDSAAQGYAKLKPLQIMFKLETNEEYGIALPKGSVYKDVVNATLKELIDSGEVVNIIAKNFDTEVPAEPVDTTKAAE